MKVLIFVYNSVEAFLLFKTGGLSDIKVDETDFKKNFLSAFLETVVGLLI